MQYQTTCGVLFVSLHLALHTRAGFRHPDLAFIMETWDRLTGEIKARLIEIIQTNLTTLGVLDETNERGE